MPSLLWCGSRHRVSRWKQIEEKAAHLEQLPSWTAADNSLILQAFEWHVPADRQHWHRLRCALPGYKTLGVDRIWIPPGCKGMDPDGNGYDIYDLYDLGEFDQKGAVPTKWGTRKELEELISQAQTLGIGVIWDAVLNHKAGADYPESFEAIKVDPKQRNLEISKPAEIHGWTGFDFAGRGDTYSSMKYHWQHFSGVDWDDKRKQHAIFKISAPAKDWAQDVSTENGNYDYLMFADLDLAHPEVRADILQWGVWITDTLRLSGMRLDAAKHFSTEFQHTLIQHIRKTTNPNLFVIGEYWTGHLPSLLGYLDKMKYDLAAYDVPLLERFSRISYTHASDLRGMFQGTLVQCRPDHAITLVSNHDTQPGQMLETPVAPPFKLLAYALILLRQNGLPCVFYGDLYGIRGNCDTQTTPSCNGQLPLLMQARKHYAYGEQQDYFDQPNCIGFVRYGNSHHLSGLACVISNAGVGMQRMYVGKWHAYEKWSDLLHLESKHIVIDKKGYGSFSVKAMSVSVWVNSASMDNQDLQSDLDTNIYDV